MPTQTAPTRGYAATKDQLLTRLRRIEGQMRGLQGMVEEDRYCIDVRTQISAAQPHWTKSPLDCSTITRVTAWLRPTGTAER